MMRKLELHVFVSNICYLNDIHKQSGKEKEIIFMLEAQLYVLSATEYFLSRTVIQAGWVSSLLCTFSRWDNFNALSYQDDFFCMSESVCLSPWPFV